MSHYETKLTVSLGPKCTYIRKMTHYMSHRRNQKRPVTPNIVETHTHVCVARLHTGSSNIVQMGVKRANSCEAMSRHLPPPPPPPPPS